MKFSQIGVETRLFEVPLKMYTQKDIVTINRQNLRDLLDDLRSRPLNWLSSKSITALIHFLKGFLSNYIFGQYNPNPYIDFMEFEKWISDKYMNTWKENNAKLDLMYLSISNGNEERAFNRFFDDWEEYKKATNVV